MDLFSCSSSSRQVHCFRYSLWDFDHWKSRIGIIKLLPVLPLVPTSPHRRTRPINKPRLRLPHPTLLIPPPRAARHEIRNQHHERHQPCDGGHERRAQGADDGRAQRGEEGEEGKAAGYGVKDHDAGERFGGVLGGGAIVAGADAVEEGHWRVADAGLGAAVSALAGRLLVIARVGWGGRVDRWGDCSRGGEKVPEGTKVDGVAILEVDAEDGEVLDDGRRDGGDDEEDAGCEEEERAQVAEESEGHLCDLSFSSPFLYISNFPSTQIDWIDVFYRRVFID
ncbi:hypothetical protein V496_06885 [Pseudogymnoascus sp. VKM F-4515 (FW-2607)]|nr:hypothetical protein V496_06885 [Pseudogymnoascus sp. VKM F-4515 (FW-2607)]